MSEPIEGIEKEDDVFAAESAAWFAAVAVHDYIATTEAGDNLRLGMYGEPYRTSSAHAPILVAVVKTAFQKAVDVGLEVVHRERPSLDDVFTNNPYLARSRTRAAYMDQFNDMLEGFGLRSVHRYGVQYYLDKVPHSMDLLAYQAPDGLRTIVNADGYISEELDVDFDPDRPFGQRGVFADRPRTPKAVERISKQLGYLAMHVDMFAFNAVDLLGYRPLDQTDEGIDRAWQGWESTAV